MKGAARDIMLGLLTLSMYDDEYDEDGTNVGITCNGILFAGPCGQTAVGPGHQESLLGWNWEYDVTLNCWTWTP